MRSTSVRVSIVISAALLAMVLFGSNVLAQSVSISVVSPFSPNIVPVCNEADATFSGAVLSGPTVDYGCYVDDDRYFWGWSVDGAPGVGVLSSDPSSATIYASICTPGVYPITVTYSDTWEDSCENGYTANASVTLNLTVVAVTSITPLSEVSQKNIGDTLTKADFSITTNPPGYEDLVTVDPVTIQIGDNYVTASCGCSSATTDVIGCICSGSLSDLFVGSTGYDDYMNFTALVQGCDGDYTVTGSDSSAVIDGGDTSGSLTANQPHSGAVLINSNQPSDEYISRLPIIQNGSLVYGLGGILDTSGTKQINGQGWWGYIKLGVRGAGPVGAVVGTAAAIYEITLGWQDPAVKPSGTVPISVTASVQNFKPTTVNSTFKMEASGRARYSGLGYKYTSEAALTLNVQAPTPLKVTNTTTGKDEFAATYAWVGINIAMGNADSNVQAGTSVSDSKPGESQFKNGGGNAQLYIVDANNAVDNANWSVSNTFITITWYSN